MPPFNEAAQRTIDAHEDRLQRLEEETREHAADIATHTANLDRINEVFDLKMKLVMDMVQATHKNVSDSNATLGLKVDGFSQHLSQVASQLSTNSGRLERLEAQKTQHDARVKWLKASLSTLAMGGCGYLIQQLLSHYMHK